MVLKLVKFGQPGHKDNPSISAKRRAGETELGELLMIYNVSEKTKLKYFLFQDPDLLPTG